MTFIADRRCVRRISDDHHISCVCGLSAAICCTRCCFVLLFTKWQNYVDLNIVADNFNVTKNYMKQLNKVRFSHLLGSGRKWLHTPQFVFISTELRPWPSASNRVSTRKSAVPSTTGIPAPGICTFWSLGEVNRTILRGEPTYRRTETVLHDTSKKVPY